MLRCPCICFVLKVCIFSTRYLGRKYFVIWNKRVFGRVLFSLARQHWKVQCERRVFKAWQEQWWVECKEWKLGIRAECHNRSVIYLPDLTTCNAEWLGYVCFCVCVCVCVGTDSGSRSGRPGRPTSIPGRPRRRRDC